MKKKSSRSRFRCRALSDEVSNRKNRSYWDHVLTAPEIAGAVRGPRITLVRLSLTLGRLTGSPSQPIGEWLTLDSAADRQVGQVP